MLVDCCAECNSILQARPLWGLWERKLFIHYALQERYAQLLSRPIWTDAELSALGPELRARIECEDAAQVVALHRIEHAGLSRSFRAPDDVI